MSMFFPYAAVRKRLQGLVDPNPDPAMDATAQYFDEVGRYPLLTRAEERDLGYRARGGDEAAREMLVTHNLRFAVEIAKRFQGRGVPLMDLIQSANIGLMRAAKRYDPDHKRAGRFIAYAVHWIRNEIFLGLKAQEGVVMPTRTQMGRVWVIRDLITAAESEGRTLSVADLVEETGYTAERVEEALRYHNQDVLSLDASVADDDARGLSEVVGRDDPAIDAFELESERQATLAFIRRTLSAREAHIVGCDLGLGPDGESEALTDIGIRLGISRERTRQLKERAFKKLRAAVEDEQLSFDLAA